MRVGSQFSVLSSSVGSVQTHPTRVSVVGSISSTRKLFVNVLVYRGMRLSASAAKILLENAWYPWKNSRLMISMASLRQYAIDIVSTLRATRPSGLSRRRVRA